METHFEIEFSPKSIPCARYAPSMSSKSSSDPISLIFTHGATGELTSPGILNFSTGYSSISPIVCFKGSSNLKNRTSAFQTACEHEKFSTALGGRSMGSRAAVLGMNDDTKKLVLCSYPLNDGKNTRDQILLNLEEDVKVLFMIGDKDGMCDLKELENVRKEMKAKSWLVVVKGADHGMKVNKGGTDVVGVLAGKVAAGWVTEEDAEDAKTEGVINWDPEETKAEWSGWR